jgi:long-chain acyl-CoA synthetase
LQREKNLVWFPEGQCSSNGELQKFKRGIGMLLGRYRVPVFIRGTHKVMAPGKARTRPGKVTLVFGEPISADDLERQGEGDGPQDRIVNGLRDRVEELGGLS